MKNSRKLFIGAMVLFLSFHPLVKADTEPNDTYQQANHIELNTEHTGNLSSTDTRDWYRFQVNTDGRLNFNDVTTSNLDYWIRLYDADGTTLIKQELRYKNNTGTRISISLTPGFYYIEFNRHSSDANGSYTFILQFDEVSRPGDSEPNDTSEDAWEVAINTSISGNLGHRKIGMYDQNDWYKFTVPADGRLLIQDTTTSDLDYWLRLYEADGTTLIKQELRYKNNSGARISVSLSPGTYYLLFNKHSADFTTFGEYFFTLVFTEVSREGDHEPNDSMEEAQEVGINTSISGNLGHRKIGMYDQNDWYKFTIPADGRLFIRDTTTSDLDYWIRLYEGDGTTLIRQELRYKTNSGTRISISLSPGTYYLLFNKHSSDYTTFGEYFFTPVFTEVSREGDHEPNDSMEEAQEVGINTSISGNLGHRKIGMYDQNDWYKFTIPADGRLFIRDTTTSDLDYWIRLYEADGTTLIRQELRYKNNSGEKISVSLSPGTYYLLFNKHSSDYTTFGEYFFTLVFTEVSRPGDPEPNDSIQHAVRIRTDSLFTGNLGHRKKGMYDNFDWYKFSLPEFGLLMFHDTTTPNLEYRVFLYNAADTSRIREILRYKNNSGSRISELLTEGEYYLLFRKHGSDYTIYGEYSFYPEFLPRPKADFTFVQNISTVSFTNKTLYGKSYRWFFDDGKESTEVNPGHDFIEPGEYKVTLIAMNPAGSDTVSHYVTIEGLKKIIDNIGGNTGNVSVSFYGGGFSIDSKVKFKREGHNDIIPDTLIYNQKGVINALFDLRGASVGEWDVEIETPGMALILEKGGFTIVEGTIARPWVEITGRSQALLGRWQTYTINYGNNGNVDASGVPLWFAISDIQDIEVLFADFRISPPEYAVNNMQLGNLLLDSIPLYFETDTLFGKPFHSRVYPFIIPVIPAGQTGQLTIRIKSMQNYQLMAWVNPPMFASPMNQQVKDCIFWAQLKAFTEGIVGIVGSALPIGCINSVITNYIYNPWAYEMPTDNEPKSIGSHMWTLASTVINCAGDIPIFKAYKMTVAILQFGASVIDNSIADAECRKAFSNESKTNLNVATVTSFDPNEKAGPEGVTEHNYIRRPPVADYTVFFENVDTASAPAQEILIIDSLDLSIFDIGKFNFKSVSIADHTVNILPGFTEFSVDIDMRPGMDIITRATGSIDTVSGVATWLFRALDPATMDDNEDPDIGVLLPNIIPPQGDGNVRFSIGLKPEVGNNDTLKNKALIIFDFNEPIITNEYMNIIDSEKPISTVMPLPAEMHDEIILEMNGFDEGSGIDYYTIYASADGGEFVPVLKTFSPQITYTPDSGSHFRFYSVATDLLGHTENAPASFQAQTNLVLSANPVKTKPEITLWPNPTGDLINININGTDGREVVLELRNIMGKSLLRKQLLNGQEVRHTLDLAELIPGIYILNISIGGNEYVEKIVKF